MLSIIQKYTTQVALTLLFLFTLKQQAQVVINNAGVININGGTLAKPTYLVLNSPPATPIKTIGTTGGIMMESEYNITKYNLGVATTNITVPYFSNNSGSFVQFPLAVTAISGAAVSTATAGLQFSSKHAPAFASGWDDALYTPSDVTNGMGGFAPPGATYTADNSAYVIDRFWIIDALGYSTTPAVTYAFGYITAEANANGGNTIAVANLQAQAYDRGAFTWGNYSLTGVNATGATEGTVSSVPVGAGLTGSVFRTWTLVDHLAVLPVDLLNFAGTCASNGTMIKWSTASESNSNYFTIEKSYDAQNFFFLANVNAVGNSTQTNNYSYFDAGQTSTVYYRLSETDKNGAQKAFKIITVNGCGETKTETLNVYFSNNQNVVISLNSPSAQVINIGIYDVTGRLILGDIRQAEAGDNTFHVGSDLAQGMYLFNIKTNTNNLVKKIIIAK
jgi:hypothetical protein